MLIGGAAALAPIAAVGQSRVARVAVLDQPGPELWGAFTEALRAHGWVEGRNLEFDICSSEGRAERYPACAAALVRLQPDLIVTSGSQATAAVHALTRSIPIVMRGVNDPVAAGLVASLARPGGNITGLTFGFVAGQVDTTSGRFLQLLKQMRPDISRIAMLWTPGNQGSAAGEAATRAMAPWLGVGLQPVAINTTADLAAAFAAVVRSGAEALLVQPTPVVLANRQQIIAFAAEQRLPTISPVTQMTRDGLLMSLQPAGIYQWLRIADYAAFILRGARPADLSVEQLDRFEFAVNLRTARAIGIELPRSILDHADEVID
jgi:putative tryptophan/tyrosine transport system substrate-binding protein